MRRRSGGDECWIGGEGATGGGGDGGKRRRVGGDGAEEVGDGKGMGATVEMGEDQLFEVLRHADAATLARAACVSRMWRRTAEDERLWEGACTRHWPNVGCGPGQLRTVVLALGGFRRLHALYVRPFLRQPSSSAVAPPSSSPFPPIPVPPIASSSTPPPLRKAPPPPARWGKDEVHLSLCLYSIRYFNDKITPTKR